MSGCSNIYDLEAVDEQLNDQRKAQAMGFLDLWHFEEFKTHAANGLLNFGDGFTRALGVALMAAKIDDAIRIVRYWNQECQQSALLYKMFLAKERAKHST